MQGRAVIEQGSTFAGSYRVIRPLGEGGMGSVYVVEQLATGAHRALKIMSRELCANRRLVELFHQEARIGHRIPSDHVVQVLDAGVDEKSGTPWLVMELLEGEDLWRHVQQVGALAPGRVVEILAQVGHALAAAHSVHVVHRDIKPENIFLGVARREGTPLLVKLLDFGVAKVVADAQPSGTLIGSPMWMAPEQINGTPVSPATDVWALGLLAFWMLTGHFYWTLESGFLGHLLFPSTPGDLFPPPSARAAELGRAEGIPPGFDAWFSRCVSVDANARFTSGDEACRALWGVLGGPPGQLASSPTRIAEGAASSPALESRRVVSASFAAGSTTELPSSAVPRVLARDAGAVEALPPAGVSRRVELVRDILQWLKRSDCVGVALLAPIGFEARQVAADILSLLQRPAEPLVPVRLVPEQSGAREDGFYERLLRDLRWGLPSPWRRYVDGRTDASAVDRFEYAVEDLLEGPVAEAGKALLFVVEGLAHVPNRQLEHWGYLMARLSSRGLRLLVWGGQELHDLRTRPASGGRFSAFHVLRAMPVGPLSLAEVRALVVDAGHDAGAVAVVYEATGGHPALVREVLEGCAEALRAGEREAIALRLLAGEHAARLRRALAADPEAHAVLQALSRRAPLPKGLHPAEEERLRWLGVLREAGPMEWEWTAPMMRRLADGVVGSGRR